MNDNAATTIGTTQIAVFRHYYGGISREPVQNRFMDSINPSTGKVHGIVARGCSEDVNRAVKVATAAGGDGWRKLTAGDRRELLLKMAELMEERRDRLYQIDAVEAGKTLTSCIEEWNEAIGAWKFYAGVADGAVVHSATTSATSCTSHRVPVGVVAIILPAISPALDFSRYAAAALACGNTIVVKPSEFACRSVLQLAQLTKEAGFPDGTVNVVCGTGEDTGNFLARHPMVNHVCFMGSTEAGRIVAANASSNLSGVTCELSAKNSVVVFDDADLDAAAEAAVRLAFVGNGQSNFCAQRILMHTSIKKAFTERVLALVSKLITGNPLRPKTTVGPLVCSQNKERVDCFVRMALNDGARILTGGEMLNGGKYGDGFFFQPTVLDKVTPQMSIATEETRGPVITLMEFGDDDRAMEICNQCRYGMAVWLFTEKLSRAQSFSSKLEMGNVLINHGPISRISLPISPCKESGLGSNLGFEAVTTLTRIKTVCCGA
jgi:acyl-CoA reductase-like NAD-dependent aldehyde dehydrogenase